MSRQSDINNVGCRRTFFDEGMPSFLPASDQLFKTLPELVGQIGGIAEGAGLQVGTEGLAAAADAAELIGGPAGQL